MSQCYLNNSVAPLILSSPSHGPQASTCFLIIGLLIIPEGGPEKAARWGEGEGILLCKLGGKRESEPSFSFTVKYSEVLSPAPNWFPVPVFAHHPPRSGVEGLGDEPAVIYGALSDSYRECITPACSWLRQQAWALGVRVPHCKWWVGPRVSQRSPAPWATSPKSAGALSEDTGVSVQTCILAHSHYLGAMSRQIAIFQECDLGTCSSVPR